MSKGLYLALGIAALVGAAPAYAQQDKGGEQRNLDFPQMKQRPLERLDHGIVEMQKARTCIQQAQDENALKACRPERRGEGGGPRGGAGGPR